jgi:hypothetical protein
MRMPGVSFRERMSGSYWLLDAPTVERAISLGFEAHAADVREFLRTRTWMLAGTIDAEGLALRREVEGTIRYALLEERRVPYRFAFRGEDGHRYELTGQKEWAGFAPLASMTLLPATIVDERGEELARATLRFDLRSDWADWMKSFRLRMGV